MKHILTLILVALMDLLGWIGEAFYEMAAAVERILEGWE